MKWMIRVLVCAVLALFAKGTWAQTAVPARQDAVFQFMFSAARTDWPDGSKTMATAYLWVPEKTVRLRGLLVLGTNVPEQMLAANAQIRAVAAANDLGIVWSSPTFYNFGIKDAGKEYTTVVAYLQELLDGLAQVSGYEEVATVPWLPLGESGHLLMVDALVEAAPERCLAGIWLKNPHLPPHNRTVPALVIYGTAQEWSQDKNDYRTLWQDMQFYTTALAERSKNPEWPLSVVIDGGSGHFDVSAELVGYLAHYIDAVAKARLPRAGESGMRAVDLNAGYLAGLPVPGQAHSELVAYGRAAADGRGLPWYFDRETAAEAQSVAAINWQAQSQLVGFTDGSGKVLPFDFNGITAITPVMDADGVTFHMRPVLLDKLPENFLHAGEPLAKTEGTPAMEWMCGAVEPAGGDAYRVALDRGYRQQGVYYVARQPGSATVRASVQPIGIKLQPHNEGAAQHIDFTKIGDVKAGAAPIALHATSDKGLPVGFFVVAGPAKIEDGRLVLTPIPPRTKFPVAVTVAAWQWGRGVEPKIKTAETVKQTFLITK